MNWVDYTIVAVLVISTIAGLWRGFTREVLSLLTWIGAFWVAWAFGPWLAPRLGQFGVHLDDTGIRLYLSYAVLFAGALLVGLLLAAVIVRLVRSSVLANPDRSLGACVGLVRGLFIVVAVIMVVNVHGTMHRPLWRSSVLVAKLSPLASQLQGWLPASWLAPLARSTTGGSPPV
ncbi:MAG TPA: CvpA family protein [Nevskiaceae bacterium]|nr:CvpA family protein [Nevskiaceae bacterium]